MALQLETERVRRDLARMERELEEVRREVAERERQGREAALRLATAVRFWLPPSAPVVHFWTSRTDESQRCPTQQSENKDLASQLAAQTQLRLTVVDKHEAVTKVRSPLPLAPSPPPTNF